MPNEKKNPGDHVQFLGPYLLGRHVGCGAECYSGGRELLFRPIVRGDLCHTEIQYFGVVPVGNKNVCRLDVAVDDALRVGSIQSISDLDSQIEQRLDCQGLSADPAPECLALEQLHREENAPLSLVNLVNGTNVRMIQR